MEVEKVAWAVAAMVKAGVVELVAMETVVTHSTRRSRCMQPRWQLHHHPDT